MQILSRKMFVGLAAGVLATTCLGFAGSQKKSHRATDVTFSGQTRFNNGDTLSAGTYRMEVPENSQTPKVQFFQNGKIVASAEATVVSEQKKNPSTEIDTVTQGNTQAVTAIRPEGWQEELKFGSAANSAAQ